MRFLAFMIGKCNGDSSECSAHFAVPLDAIAENIRLGMREIGDVMIDWSF
jgi:hypothetical protein